MAAWFGWAFVAGFLVTGWPILANEARKFWRRWRR
jgi:hypothetical protein